MNYKNGKIYKIVCNITGQVYIGSCITTLVKRLSNHKSKGNKCSSSQIISRGDYVIVLIEAFPCESKDELFKRERYHYDLIPNINKQRPFRTGEECSKGAIATYNKEYQKKNSEAIATYKNAYYESNTEAIATQHKQYYQANKEAIATQNKAYYEANKDTALTYQKAYYENNKDSALDYRKAYYEANTETIATQNKAYREKNKEAISKRRKARYQAKKTAANQPS